MHFVHSWHNIPQHAYAKMSSTTESGVSSPWFLSSGSDCGDADTPLTERSVLFDEEDIANAVHRSNQHILVVGGLGFIGSHTCWELAKAGYNVSTRRDESSTKGRTLKDFD